MQQKWNLRQVVFYLLAIIVWVNNFQQLKIQTFWVFCEGNDIAHGSNEVGFGVEDGSIKWSAKTIEIQRSHLGSSLC